MAKNRQNLTATIPNLGTTSDAVTIPVNSSVLALVTPGALTGTSFTFQGSADGQNYFSLFDEGSAYSVSAAASRYIALKEQVFKAPRFLRIISNATEGAIRTITVVTAEA